MNGSSKLINSSPIEISADCYDGNGDSIFVGLLEIDGASVIAIYLGDDVSFHMTITMDTARVLVSFLADPAGCEYIRFNLVSHGVKGKTNGGRATIWTNPDGVLGDSIRGVASNGYDLTQETDRNNWIDLQCDNMEAKAARDNQDWGVLIRRTGFVAALRALASSMAKL